LKVCQALLENISTGRYNCVNKGKEEVVAMTGITTLIIGRNIRSIRESRGLSQVELASKIGVTAAAVSSWEVGRTEPKIGMIEKISVALNCKKTDIIGRDTPLDLTDHERAVVIAYRQNPSMQDAVDRLLGIEKRELYSASEDRREA
jgi:transcriptional regulator with XRE-family HTH domain